MEEAGMKQLDDAVGALMKHVEDIGEADNTTTDATAMIRPSCYKTKGPPSAMTSSTSPDLDSARCGLLISSSNSSASLAGRSRLTCREW